MLVPTSDTAGSHLHFIRPPLLNLQKPSHSRLARLCDRVQGSL